MIALGGLSGPPGHPPLLGGNPPKGGVFEPPKRGVRRPDLEVDLYPGVSLQNIFSKKFRFFKPKTC